MKHKRKCNKKSYNSKYIAEQSALYFFKEKHVVLRIYWCGQHKAYHLTHRY